MHSIKQISNIINLYYKSYLRRCLTSKSSENVLKEIDREQKGKFIIFIYILYNIYLLLKFLYFK